MSARLSIDDIPEALWPRRPTRPGYCWYCREPIDYNTSATVFYGVYDTESLPVYSPMWEVEVVVGPQTSHRQCYERWLRRRASLARKLGRVACSLVLDIYAVRYPAGAAFGIGLVGAGILIGIFYMVGAVLR